MIDATWWPHSRVCFAVSLVILLIGSRASYARIGPGPGYDAWLRYEPVQGESTKSLYDRLPATLVALSDSPVVSAAQAEMLRGIRGMLHRTLRIESRLPPEDAIVVADLAALNRALPHLTPPAGLIPDGFWLKSAAFNGHTLLIVAGRNDRGALYGTFALLRRMSLHEPIEPLDELENPYAPIRWINQWDNLDGSIERGYAGRSIFFEGGSVLPDLTRAADYARLLASLGVNGCTVNNVNANPRVLGSDFLPQIARIADAFRPWGVRLSLAVQFASPKTAGGLETFDPLDPQVAAWWRAKADEIYRLIPDFAGFVLKADSEGQAGPSAYGRTHADAANLLARALQPHHGVLIYRGFVYNHHLDWRDLKNDRARAAYDNFQPLDGKFDANAAIQIKYGPIDFQAREPVSPLIAALPRTNQTLELQITQEYTGQQRHLCYLVPMWKQILDFDLRANGGASENEATPVKQIVAGRAFHRPLGGLVGVANVGRDPDWLANDLALANLYGFGRLAWNPDLSARQITEEWTRLTFGNDAGVVSSRDARVVETIMSLQLESWRVYERYTGPLGLGTLTDILHGHYGPGIETAERNGWGQWIRADHNGVGMDRTVATGTGFIGQYPPEVARLYESLETCPDALLLFMHHVPYTYVLHSGKTVIQYVYDSHYEAAAEAQQFPEWWRTLRGRIDPERYSAVLAMLEYQAGHAIVWRDAICSWFLRMSGIPDAKGRAGHFPNRIEAESMQLTGYSAVDVQPWEDASGGRAIECAHAQTCSAQFVFDRPAGWYDLAVQYFDLNTGAARFRVYVGAQEVAVWTADAALPAGAPNGDSSTRKRITSLALRPGDTIRIEGTPDGGDFAAVDYVEVTP
jgi:alpha-glucuronidase